MPHWTAEASLRVLCIKVGHTRGLVPTSASIAKELLGDKSVSLGFSYILRFSYGRFDTN